MDLWYSEYHTDDVRFSIRVNKQLCCEQSEFQRIDIFDSPEFGRILVMDGYLMLTEKDEFVYHEMIVHVPMAVNPKIKKVLVIGAGDGGTVRELCRYPGVSHIDLVEIDKMVVELSRKYLPFTACRLDDPRVHIHFEDGLKFVRTRQEEYDLIIVDSTDPFGPGEGLFTKEFYGSCHKALTAEGILINQHESAFYRADREIVGVAHRRIGARFPLSDVYQAHIPTYPSGHWLFGFASKKHHPTDRLDKAAWNALDIETRYYNTALHIGAFAIPNYVKELLLDESV